MYDPDPRLPVLRLGDGGTVLKPAEPFKKVFERHYRIAADGTEQRDLAAELAAAERDMEEAIKRWVSASMDYATERMQSQPISAARQSVGDGMMRYEPAPTIFRQDGRVERF